jgi:hypothetical protein
LLNLLNFLSLSRAFKKNYVDWETVAQMSTMYQTQKRRWSSLLSLLSLSLLAVGCEDAAPTVKVYPAAGRVLLDGKPVEGVAITLVPDAGAVGRGGYALSDASGSFSVKSVDGQDGVPPGKYKVLFQKLALPDGSPLPPGANAADVDAKNILPEPYSNPDIVNVFADIAPADNLALEFPLKSNRRR